MKIFFLLLLILLNLPAFAQDFPAEFYDTWFPVELFPHDGHAEPVFRADVAPAISPYITINENLEVSGMGACNSFTGQISYEYDFAELINFASTDLECESASQNAFESAFFEYLISCSWDPVITQLPNGRELYMTTLIFGYGEFNNFSMHTGESRNSTKEIRIYPNPAGNFFSLNLSEIQQVEIYDTNGKLLRTVLRDFDRIPVETLSKGIYLLKIKSADNIIHRKLIKK